jgi:hypothetical protein
VKVDTKAAREFSEGGDRYTGAEVRLWVHNLADEVDRLRTALAALCEAADSTNYPLHGPSWDRLWNAAVDARKALDA